ncbi:hypothetical protein ACFL5V_03295 [Fibrobacterota bacterium]
MKKDRPLFPVLSRRNIRRLIKIMGLQGHIFDNSLFTLEWEGLEYRFFIRDDRLLLESVFIRMDIGIAPMEMMENDSWPCWLKNQGR